jgi:hypothetical protein
MREMKPGPSSGAGLDWLARVGPSPLEAWGLAMGWGRAATYSHAKRLRAAGWVEDCRRIRGVGTLVYATRRGVRVAGSDAIPLATAPAPTTWAHNEACAWAATWLTVRGRTMVGSREILASDFWSDEVRWLDRNGVHRSGHRPDLAAGLSEEGPMIPVEVELARKSKARVRAILGLHASWIAAGKTPAVIYICENARLANRVRQAGADAGLSSENKTLRIELLRTVRDVSRAGRSTNEESSSNGLEAVAA